MTCALIADRNKIYYYKRMSSETCKSYISTTYYVKMIGKNNFRLPWRLRICNHYIFNIYVQIFRKIYEATLNPKLGRYNERKNNEEIENISNRILKAKKLK